MKQIFLFLALCLFAVPLSAQQGEAEREAMYYIRKAYSLSREGKTEEALKAVKHFETYLGGQLTPERASDSIAIYYARTLGVLLQDNPQAVGSRYSWAVVKPYALRLAERGHSYGNNLLGVCYALSAEREQAMQYFRLAAERGDAHALCNLGRMYYDQGKSTEALPLYRRAASLGNPLATENLTLLETSSYEEVIPCKYESAGAFREGLAPVKFRGKWGFIDKAGREVVPFRYDDSSGFKEGLAWVMLNRKCGFIDKSGQEVIPFKYDIAYNFQEGLAGVKLKGKWGFIDKKGRVAIDIKYEDINYFTSGVTYVKYNGQWKLIDRQGKEIQYNYESVGPFRDGLAGAKLNGKYGFIDRTGKVVIPFKYEAALSFSEGLAWVKSNGQWRIIDKTGQMIVPKLDKYEVEWVIPFQEGIAWVYYRTGMYGKHKAGAINRKGEVVIPPKYDWIYGGSDFNEGLARVSLKERRGFVDKEGREVIPIQYVSVGDFSEGLAWVNPSGKGIGFIGKVERPAKLVEGYSL